MESGVTTAGLGENAGPVQVKKSPLLVDSRVRGNPTHVVMVSFIIGADGVELT